MSAKYTPDHPIAGFVVGAATVALITHAVGEARFAEWGWRIPFFSLPLGIIGLYLRNRLEETPVYQQHSEQQAQKANPKNLVSKKFLLNISVVY